MKKYYLITTKRNSEDDGNIIYENVVTERTPVEYLLLLHSWGVFSAVLINTLEITKEEYEKAKDKI